MLISLAKLYTAFNLSPQELADLLHLLQTPAVIPLKRLIIDPTELRGREHEPPLELSSELSSEYAKRYTRRVFGIPRARRRLVDQVLKHLLDLFYELELGHDALKEWEPISTRWTNDCFYTIIMCYINGCLWVLRNEIYELLEASYLFFSMVSLEEAVQLLYRSTYPLHREVKGLTRERFQELVEKKPEEALKEDHPLLTNNEVLPELLNGETPAEKRQRRMPIRALLSAIKAEADKHGLDKKFYVTTDRTIRNWLSEASSAPPGFSEAVLSSLESISDFAQKYIEICVAAGSSELAANAKKEVAFNDQLHGLKLETVEDFDLMEDALKDAKNHVLGVNKSGLKRRPKRS